MFYVCGVPSRGTTAYSRTGVGIGMCDIRNPAAGLPTDQVSRESCGRVLYSSPEP